MTVSHAPLQARELPRFIRELLACPPPPGTGLHPWIYRMACLLKPWRDDDETAALLSAVTHDCGRNTSREIRQAVRHARSRFAGKTADAASVPVRPAWPARDDALIASVLRDGFAEADLWEASPVRLAPGSESTTHEMLATMFPGDPLLCLGWRLDACDTRTRSEWSRVPAQPPLQFIVPNPMTAREGVTQDGRRGPRTKQNTAARRFLVVEFDFSPDRHAPDARLLHAARAHGLHSTRDLCACLLHHLASAASPVHAPLALVVWSGGKSLHGWFPAAAVADEVVERFFHRACRLGADRATWTRSQMVRLPYGVNTRTGKFQNPMYFNPCVLPPIP